MVRSCATIRDDGRRRFAHPFGRYRGRGGPRGRGVAATPLAGRVHRSAGGQGQPLGPAPGRQGQGRGRGPHPPIRPARPRQDDPRDDRGARARASTSATRRDRPSSGPGTSPPILTSLDERDVLFIDEVHRLNRAVEEILYPAMEDYALDVMIGKGPSARSLRLSLKPFTVVGATTRAGRISSPLRDRFGATYRLDFYTDDELASIVRRSAEILGVADRRGRDLGDRPARAGNATHREPAAQAGSRQRRGAWRRPGRRADRAGRDADDGDRRRGARLGGPQAPRRDRPEVRLRVRSGWPPWPPSCPRRRTPSRTSTSRSCCGSASSTARPRAGSRPTSVEPTCPGLGYEIPPPRRSELGDAVAVGRARAPGTPEA